LIVDNDGNKKRRNGAFWFKTFIDNRSDFVYL